MIPSVYFGLNGGGLFALVVDLRGAGGGRGHFVGVHREIRAEQHQPDAQYAQRRQRLPEHQHRQRERDEEIHLLQRGGEIAPDRLRRAVIAVAAPEEMHDAGARQDQHGVKGEIGDQRERAAQQSRDEEKRHPDRHRDGHGLRHRTGEHAAPQARIVEGKSGRRQKREKTCEH